MDKWSVLLALFLRDVERYRSVVTPLRLAGKKTDDEVIMFLEVQEQEIVTTVYRVVAGESDVIRTYPTKAEADAFAAGWNQAADEATLYEEQPDPVEAAEEPEQVEELEEAVAETTEQPDDLPAFEQEYVYLSDSPADDDVTEDTEPLVEAL